MITAKEAREISLPTDEEIINQALEVAYKAIRLKATARGREIVIYDNFWAFEGFSKTDRYKKACDKLKKLGFNLDFFYEEWKPISMGTIIKW